jgi:Bifunctional DNA primase/polymerase, N-terminal
MSVSAEVYKTLALKSALAAGWRVVPVSRKVPVVAGWVANPFGSEQALSWADQNPEHDWAVHTGHSGLLVLDIDDPDGFDTIHRLLQVFGPLPDAPLISTPSGGAHLYFRHLGGKLRAWMGPGLEVKRGGLLVTFTGRGREVLSDQAPWDGPLPALPEPWLVSLRYKAPQAPKAKPPASINRHAYLRGAVRSAVDKVRKAATGERNHTLYCQAAGLGRFVRAGEMSRDETAAALYKAARWVGVPAHEAKATIASGLGGASHG